MDIGRSMAWIERQHLLETPDRLVVFLLVPGNVAELAEALDVAWMALEHGPGLSLVHRGNTQRKLDTFVLRVQLEGLAILARTLLQLAPPVGQVAAEDVAGDTPLHRQAVPGVLLLLRRVGTGETQERRDVVGKARKFGQGVFYRVVP